MMRRASDLARDLGGSLWFGLADLLVTDLARPEEGGPTTVSALFGTRASGHLASSTSGLVVCSEALAAGLSDEARSALRLEGRDLLLVDDPAAAFVTLLNRFRPAPPFDAGVHSSAVVAAGVRLPDSVHVGALAVVEAEAVIGEGAVIEAQAYVGEGVVVGPATHIGPGARLLRGTRLGQDVVIGAGSVLGSAGFGHLEPDLQGQRTAIPQRGGVLVGDGTQIGALCAVDRGTLGDTRIGKQVRVDNLVQLGHNSIVEDCAVLVAQVGISGSSQIGRGAILAGQSGVADHRRVGRGAVLLARAAAFRDVPDDEVYGGNPARPRNEWMRQQAVLHRLARKGDSKEEDPR